jgi:hypothetical protein
MHPGRFHFDRLDHDALLFFRGKQRWFAGRTHEQHRDGAMALLKVDQ